MEFNTVLKSRRSIRKYQDKAVDRALLKEMIQYAIYAPSWKNSQTARYYVVDSKEMLDKVKDQALPEFNAKNSVNAGALIVTTFVKNRSGFERDGTPSNEIANHWGAYDLGLHNQNLVLKAAELGLGTVIMGIRDADALAKLLTIPETEMIVAIIAVGYPDIDPQMPKRKEVDEITKFF